MQTRKQVSKAGIVGAVAGAAVSTKIYSKNDTAVDKAIKTGTSAGIGYLLGSFLERLFNNYSRKKQGQEN
ncbi:MAG: hypothetical protein IPM71_03170 [Bacteroidota bacterium]|nr:MAG: hypothetical protein IPM71_03170 [Bacteroidota bacterium]